MSLRFIRRHKKRPVLRRRRSIRVLLPLLNRLSSLLARLEQGRPIRSSPTTRGRGWEPCHPRRRKVPKLCNLVDLESVELKGQRGDLAPPQPLLQPQASHQALVELG